MPALRLRSQRPGTDSVYSRGRKQGKIGKAELLRPVVLCHRTWMEQRFGPEMAWAMGNLLPSSSLFVFPLLNDVCVLFHRFNLLFSAHLEYNGTVNACWLHRVKADT